MPQQQQRKAVLAVLLVSLLSVTTTTAFVVQPPTTARSTAADNVWRRHSEPSDTSSDGDYIIVESEEYTPPNDGTPDTVTTVMDLLPNSISADITNERRNQIAETLLQLEKANHDPDSKPALSPLINGVWELRYVGGYAPEWTLPSPTRQLALFLYSGGYSPGVFGLQLAQQIPFVNVGPVEIEISRVQPRVTATVPVGNSGTVQVRARLSAESSVRLLETYQEATVLGRNVPLPDALQYSRELFVTYVDEEVLVVRDGSGVPEVLVRK